MRVKLARPDLRASCLRRLFRRWDTAPAVINETVGVNLRHELHCMAQFLAVIVTRRSRGVRPVHIAVWPGTSLL